MAEHGVDRESYAGGQRRRLPTRDGTCERDCIHVVDLAEANVSAAQRNLGSACPVAESGATQLAGVALEGKYSDTGRWAGEAATVNASPWEGILATRSVSDTGSSASAWAVPAAFLAFVLDS